MDATSAIATSLAVSQSQIGIAVLRMASDSQNQVAALLAQSVVQAASSNPPNLGNLVDTYA